MRIILDFALVSLGAVVGVVLLCLVQVGSREDHIGRSHDNEER